MTTVGIIDAAIGNVGSVANMCRRIGLNPVVMSDPNELDRATHLILPGVGAWDHASTRLHESGMAIALREHADKGTPILGVCLGMQLLLDSSEEGTLPGLGWIPGTIRRLPSVTAIGAVRVPHMGWTQISARPHPIFEDLDSEARYYFVHSYAAQPADDAHVLATASYGDRFTAVIGRDNIVGTQFHPEKSHRHGKALLTSFLLGSFSESGVR